MVSPLEPEDKIEDVLPILTGEYTMKVSIPILIAQDGRFQAWGGMNEKGQKTEDVGILYESFPDDAESLLRLCNIEVEVDLKDLFRDATMVGKVVPV